MTWDRARWLAAWGYQDGTPEADAAWASKCAMHIKSAGLTIIPDISPYQAVATDVATGSAPAIMGRAQHREFLKRNGYVELGNEAPTPRREQSINLGEIGRQIKNVIDQKGIRL